MSHYEQFTAMLDNAKQVSPMVFKRKSINLTSESVYKVVEMKSPAGKILFGFNKDTGELMDVIGPCRLTPETLMSVRAADAAIKTRIGNRTFRARDRHHRLPEEQGYP